jgi:transposase-like protein
VRATKANTLERILQDLGPHLLELLLGDANGGRDVESVAIYDASEPNLPRDAIVLAVAARSHEDVVAVLERVARHDATAVVVRAPLAVEAVEELEVAVQRTGVALLGLTPGASWTQLAYLLSTLLGVRAYLRSDHEIDTSVGDLFALANTVSSLVDAPVTIEDRNFQVLAFSGRQDEADQARADTIIGRKVPPGIAQAYQAKGIFKELYSSSDPMYFAPVNGQNLPRVAVSVRAGNEVFGSIWAAVKGPLTPERERAFADSAKLVALHLLRQTVASDVTRRFKAQRVLTVLEGGTGAADAARALGLAQPSIVWAWGFPPADSAPSFQHAEADRQRVLDALSFQVSALNPSAAVTTLGDVAYAVIPISERINEAEADSVLAAQRFLDRTARQFTGKVGVSRVASDPSRLPKARRDADRALRVLQERGRDGVAGGITQLGVDALMLQLRDLAVENEHRPSAGVLRLLRYDEEKHADLVPTLAMWLESFGDVRAAARAMQVHANTFRYRMRRAIEVGQIDLDDLAGRFALMMELRLLGRGARTYR